MLSMTTLLATYIHHVWSVLKQLDYLYGDQILRNFISTVTVMCNEMAIRTVS